MKIQKKIQPAKIAFLLFPLWNFICYWRKMENFFQPLQRPACSAPSVPVYTRASLHLGPVWSLVAPRRWGKKCPCVPCSCCFLLLQFDLKSFLQRVLLTARRDALPLLAFTADQSRESCALPPVRRQESISFTSVVQEYTKTSLTFQVICECWQGWCLLSSSWYVRLLHGSLLQNLNVFLLTEHLW